MDEASKGGGTGEIEEGEGAESCVGGSGSKIVMDADASSAGFGRMGEMGGGGGSEYGSRTAGVENGVDGDRDGSEAGSESGRVNGHIHSASLPQTPSDGSPTVTAAATAATDSRKRVGERYTSDPQSHSHQGQRESLQDTPRKEKKKHRVKSSGGFLLDPVSFSDTLRSASGFRIRSRVSELKGKKKKVVEDEGTAESEKGIDAKDAKIKSDGQLVKSTDEAQKSNVSIQLHADSQSQQAEHKRVGDEEFRADEVDGNKRLSQDQQQHQRDHNYHHPPAIQINPKDIVNMALSLSESRRRQASGGSLFMATPSPPPPPRNFSPLAPVPLGMNNQHSYRDYSAGSSLRQHLQQQRRTPRTASPETPRRPSGFRLSSMTQSADLSGSAILRQDELVGRNYQFSSATLARAEKARNYIELSVEYRRLLHLLPPLQKSSNDLYPAIPNSSRNPITAVAAAAAFARRSGELSRVSTTEDGSASVETDRTYNPLQAIRDRRVRVRERQALDPDIDTWNDVRRVRPWVDEVEDTRAYANSPYHNPKHSILPEFSIMDYELHHHSTNISLRSPGKHSRDNSIGKPQRQRMDWSVSPAELFADTYWLEQDNHKTLIEDRNGYPVVANRERAENHSGRQSKEYRRDIARGRSGLAETYQGLTPSDLSAVEGFDNDSDVSERLGGGGNGVGNKKHHLRKRQALQGRFIRDRPLRRPRSSSVSSSDEANIRNGLRKRSRQVPLSHLDNIGPLERHMIMMMKEEEEEEEEEKRQMEAEEKANERAEWSAADSTDRGGDAKNTLSSVVSRQSTMHSTAESVSGSVDSHLALPSKKNKSKDLRLIHTVTTSKPANKLGLISLKDQQSAGPASPSNAKFGPLIAEDPSPIPVSRVRSLPIDRQHHEKSRLPRLPHLDVLTKGFSSISSSKGGTGRLSSSPKETEHPKRRRGSDTASLSEHDYEIGQGEAEKSPITNSIKRVGSLKRNDGHASNGNSGVNAGIFDSRIRQSGRSKDNGSAVGRFLHKKKGRLGGFVRHEGGKVNTFIRRHGGHGEDDGGGDEDGDGDEAVRGYRDEEGSGRRGVSLGVGIIDETPETSQSDGEALYATRVSTRERDYIGERAKHGEGLGESSVRQRLPTFRHTRRESMDTVSPDSPQMGMYKNALPSFKPAAAASIRNRRRGEGEDTSQRSSDKTGWLAPPASSNSLDLAKTATAESARSGRSRYSSQADSAMSNARDRSRGSRDTVDAAESTAAELNRSGTRQSSARLNAVLAVPGSIGRGGTMPMTGLANVKASNSYTDGDGRAISRVRSHSPGSERSRSRSGIPQDYSPSQNNSSRWVSCELAAPDGSKHFSIAVAERSLLRIETLLVSSGVKAKEIVRRAYAVQDPPSALLIKVAAEVHRDQHTQDQGGGIPTVSKKEEYVLAANWLSDYMEVALANYNNKALVGRQENEGGGSPQETQDIIKKITTTAVIDKTSLHALHARISALQSPTPTSPSTSPSTTSMTKANHACLPNLAARVRMASSTADSMVSDLSIVRSIPVRSLTDEVESLMRARRRRLRWVRRIVFVLLEWMLLGAMWSVWSVVVVVKIVWGLGRGVWGALRWFFWL